MKTNTLRLWSEADQLADEWNDLLERSQHASIFRTWEWIRAWRSAGGEAIEPYIITVRDDGGALKGIAPLYRASIRILGTVAYRTLRFMGDVATGSEYPDWIADVADEEDVCLQISAELARNSAEWDLIFLPKVAGWTNAESRICQSARESGLPVRTRSGPFSTLKLPADLSEFENSFSARRRQQMRRNVRNVKKLDGIEFVHCRELDEVPDFLNALFDLHQRRWEAAGLDGCFRRKPVEEKFYREFAPVAFQKGWLVLFGVQQKGTFKAVQFGYAYGGAFLQLQEGYDPEFPYSVGNALRHYVI